MLPGVWKGWGFMKGMVIAEIKKLQAELDYRTKVEEEVEKLICQCRFEEAMNLLATLD